MTREKLMNSTFVGVIEDNKDPKKLGRCKVRVVDVFDKIPVADIPWAKPWKDSGGNVFSAPEIGKVVGVVFDSGSIYKPEFIYAEHYNVNLEKKLKGLSEEDYLSFKSVFLDQSTQIYRSKSEGLKFDHEYTNMVLNKAGNINLNLKNNSVFIKLGTSEANQQAILGNHFLDWMDTLMSTLSATPYMGNLMAPVFPSPSLIPVISEYYTSRATSKFLSNNVFIVDNEQISTQEREYINQDGDQWKSSVQLNKLTKKNPPVVNQEVVEEKKEVKQEVKQEVKKEETKKEEPKKEKKKKSGLVRHDVVPTSFQQLEIKWEGVPTNAPSATMKIPGQKNGVLERRYLAVCDRILKDCGQKSDSDEDPPEQTWYLIPDYAKAWTQLMNTHDKVNYPGKNRPITTQGYRSLQRQIELNPDGKNARAAKVKYDEAGKPIGTSPHGWGSAVDVFWGVGMDTGFKETQDPVERSRIYGSVFRHPTYQWMFNNSYKLNIYNPIWGRDNNNSYEEWWHWEYHPWENFSRPSPMVDAYAGPFTMDDYNTLLASKYCKVGYMEATMKKYGFILLYDFKGNFLYDAQGKFLGQHLFDSNGKYIELEQRKEEARKRQEAKKLKQEEAARLKKEQQQKAAEQREAKAKAAQEKRNSKKRGG